MQINKRNKRGLGQGTNYLCERTTIQLHLLDLKATTERALLTGKDCQVTPRCRTRASPTSKVNHNANYSTKNLTKV